jgi:hypothetical protein
MKAKIEVEFIKIGKEEVNEELLKNVPALLNSTENAVQILCEQIENYFRDNKIQTKATYKMIK